MSTNRNEALAAFTESAAALNTYFATVTNYDHVAPAPRLTGRAADDDNLAADRAAVKGEAQRDNH